VCCEKLESVSIWSSVSVDLNFVQPVESFIPATVFWIWGKDPVLFFMGLSDFFARLVRCLTSLRSSCSLSDLFFFDRLVFGFAHRS
jgi:hypothetical protein